MDLVFLISPAMQMDASDAAALITAAPARAPHFAADALQLARLMQQLSYEQLKALWAASDALAQPAYDALPSLEHFLALAAHATSTATLGSSSGSSAQELASLGTAAIGAFSGIQYSYLAPHIMEEAQLRWLDEHLYIGSGLYGLLRPLDWVHPYRLEMKTKLPGTPKQSLYQHWGARLAQKIAADHAHALIVNAASAEYSKAVLPHAKKLGIPSCTVTFLSPSKSGTLGQRAPECKIARGLFVRWAAEHTPKTLSDLQAFADRGYRFAADKSSAPEELVFVKEAEPERP